MYVTVVNDSRGSVIGATDQIITQVGLISLVLATKSEGAM